MSNSTHTAPKATATAPTVDNQNFANNLFTDIAPLLVLFGDETTKQFLATSMGWPDNILLATCPIGVMTIIVSAIRIGGGKLLKSVIGRARDGLDDEEKELLSSTSATVREVWNGEQIVRQTGEPKTVELVHVPDWGECPPNKPRPLYNNALNPLNEAHYRVTGSPKAHNANQIPVFYIERLVARKAPNITIYIDNAIPDPWMVFCFMGCGLLLQIGILTFNAIVVYKFGWLRAGKVVASYGYPVWAYGTISMTIGVSICARVVQDSTVNFKLVPPTDSARSKCSLVRVQRKIPELRLPPYLILGKKKNMSVKVSRRKSTLIKDGCFVTIYRGYRVIDEKGESTLERPKINPDLTTTMQCGLVNFGVIVSLIGFVCQNIGTRELHWSAAVLQLGGTFISLLLRAWLRRFVGRDPDPSPIVLQSDGETSQIISVLEKKQCHLLSEMVYFSNYPACSLYPDTRTLRFGEKLAKIIKNKETDLYESPHQRQIERLVNMQLVLARYEPDPEEITSIALGLCEAIRQVLTTIGAFAAPWHHHMILMDMNSNLEGIAPIQFLSREIPSDPCNEQTREKIQAILSLTHNYRRPLDLQRYTKYSRSERILGYAETMPEAEILEAKMNRWFGEACNAIALRKRISEAEMKIMEIDYAPQCHPILGLRFGGEIDSPNAVTHDTGFQLLDISKISMSGLHDLALDLFSSFMLDLLDGSKPEREDFQDFLKYHKDGIDILGDILISQKLCTTKHQARMAIVPVLILRGIEIGSPPGIEHGTL